ncbi:hypothetical protein JOE58_000489 [Curtobacterium luteum]|uniref:Uncharacterized protein n=1 Tax=Curtobacterium luteum TaxID=33881 RepID=A0ABS2RQG9_9MICO|nr:hypothetical protein [Curtobacterium luteum]
MRSGSPSGISTFHSTCQPVMPCALAASTVTGSTDSMPEYAPASTDGMARMTSARSGACRPIPSRRPKSDRTPSVGRARTPPDTPIEKPRRRPVWPIA